MLDAYCVLQGTFGTGITDFGREALLSREYLWDAVATRQPPPGAAPRLLAAMHALLAQRAALLPHELVQYLEAHGADVGAFLDAMDVRRQLTCSIALARAVRLRLTGAHGLARSTALSARIVTSAANVRTQTPDRTQASRSNAAGCITSALQPYNTLCVLTATLACVLNTLAARVRNAALHRRIRAPSRLDCCRKRAMPAAAAVR